MKRKQMLSFGSFRLDITNRQLFRDQRELKLTGRAFEVLVYLVERPGQLVTREELSQTVWQGMVVGDSTLAVCIGELRKALKDKAKKPQFIETIHRHGYRFVAEVHSTVSTPESQEGAVPKSERVSDKLWRWPSLSATAVVIVVLGVSGGVFQSISRPPVSQPAESLLEDGSALPLPEKPSIAVLPFVNMSGDPDQEYFSDGITDTLITDLTKLSGLFVIARSSVFTYKGKAVDVAEVSRQLGVRYVVEGSVQKIGDRVRLNVQMVDATTGGHVWAERYDRVSKDLFALQDALLQKIVTTLHLQLTLREKGEPPRRRGTENLEAYDALLRGYVHYWRLTKEANGQARQLFEKAVGLEPRYADAYAAQAITYWADWVMQWSQDPTTLKRAFELSQKALALDDALSHPHMVLGFVYLWQKRHEAALTEANQAITLDPNNATNYATRAMILNFMGRPEEAIPSMEQAMRLNPRYPNWYLLQLVHAYGLMSHYEKALAAIRKVLSREPTALVARLVQATSYVEMGRMEEARTAAAEIRQLSPTFSVEAWTRVIPYQDPAVTEWIAGTLRQAGLK